MFDILTDQIIGNVDVLVISEIKLDDSFLEGQFKTPGYSSPFCLDHYQNHCVKIVQIRRFSSPHFPAFGLNTEISIVNLRI